MQKLFKVTCFSSGSKTILPIINDCSKVVRKAPCSLKKLYIRSKSSSCVGGYNRFYETKKTDANLIHYIYLQTSVLTLFCDSITVLVLCITYISARNCLHIVFILLDSCQLHICKIKNCGQPCIKMLETCGNSNLKVWYIYHAPFFILYINK